ncbi:putative SAP domain-containing protein [Colletotrichum karsti]|uniref:SAP domain-containing protein n=1 Tax=Colletotrichum karsti TaxID=1095194 RepID=A0A9P6IFQ8_9PEZI|nr:putative SAP domain-containing protein [Colletotrichum karsti]KAF9881915.1 putative SAP domain-containing protein [Colletotrichum karsti]
MTRLTKFGKCTYGVKTGPLPDGTDWSKLPAPILKEQLAMRDVNAVGKKKDLIERLENWKTYQHETVDVGPSANSEAFGPIASTKSTANPRETRFMVPIDDKRYVSAAKKAMSETMWIIKQSPGFGDENILNITLSSGSTYNITIGRKTSCDCQAAMYNKSTNCKHVIYVLLYMLHAPAELLPQKTFFTEELVKLFALAPKARFTQDEIDADPALKDGVPKSKDGKACPVCYKNFEDKETVCCGTCGHHVHSQCFRIFKMETAGWGTKCPICEAPWKAGAVSKAQV